MSQGPSSAQWWRRALRVGLLSFVLAVLVSWISSLALAGLPAVIAFLVVLVLIGIGVAFDIVGTSVTAAEATPLNAMAAKRLHGAKQALWLVRNAGTVASFCNDVVGDVTGAVAGAAGTSVALQLTRVMQGGNLVRESTGLLVIGLIAGLTVGAKAAGKSFAIDRSTDVVFLAGRFMYGLERIVGRSLIGGRNGSSPRRRTP